MKDPLNLAGTADLDTPQFGVDPNCRISRARLFCVPASKTNVAVTDKATGTPIAPLSLSRGPADGDRICYKVKCAIPPPILPLSVTDQFGNRTVSKFSVSMLCTPAVKGVGFCGDGTIGAGEQCEPTNLGGATCESEGFPNGGTIACGPDCTLDDSGCRRAGLPATGQVTCWNTAGTIVACNGTGHDGDVQPGTPLAYQDNGDGTITDLNTGLQWEKKSDDGTIHDKDNSYTWDDAFAVHVAGLNGLGGFAGHTDWRVPSARELQSIVNYENWGPAVSTPFRTGCLGGCTVLSCSCTASTNYWSSTTDANFPALAYGVSAWVVLFDDGQVFPDNKTGARRVRAVRTAY